MLEFRINKLNLADTAWAPAEDLALQPGQVRFALERFGLSANNVTYADLGEKFSYWKFFPTADRFGLLPVWGMSRVVESQHGDFPVGMRAYGYWPMAERAVLQPNKLGTHSFVDQSPHRADLPAVYQIYQRWLEPIAAPTEARFALLRPLYMTSWLCADFLHDNACFGADTVWVLSASSKTALALGGALQRIAPDIRTIGFTSAENLAFVERTGCYHRVCSYNQIEQQPQMLATLVDMSGNRSIVARTHQHLAAMLQYSCAVGISHRGELVPLDHGLMGVKQRLFFAPDQVKKRTQEHSPGWIEKQSRADWENFLLMSTAWLDVQIEHGFDAAQSAYLSLLNGQARPDVGLAFELAA